MAARQLFGFHAAMISQHRDACSPGHANATQRNLNNDKKRQERAKFSELVAEATERSHSAKRNNRCAVPTLQT
jgi:hypothetical protein